MKYAVGDVDKTGTAVAWASDDHVIFRTPGGRYSVYVVDDMFPPYKGDRCLRQNISDLDSAILFIDRIGGSSDILEDSEMLAGPISLKGKIRPEHSHRMSRIGEMLGRRAPEDFGDIETLVEDFSEEENPELYAELRAAIYEEQKRRASPIMQKEIGEADRQGYIVIGKGKRHVAWKSPRRRYHLERAIPSKSLRSNLSEDQLRAEITALSEEEQFPYQMSLPEGEGDFPSSAFVRRMQ